MVKLAYNNMMIIFFVLTFLMIALYGLLDYGRNVLWLKKVVLSPFALVNLVVFTTK